MERYLAVEFAKKGYVCISINYRIREKLDDPSAAITDAVDDTASAVSWVIEHSEEYGIDKKFIAVGGYSAGALTAINFGYSDFKKYGIDKSNVFGVIDIAGDTLYKKRVAKEDPPCIIIQGTQDPKSSLESSKKLAKMLNDQNIYNVLYTIEGADHNLMILYDDVVNQTTMFLYEALTGNSIEVNDISGISVEYEKVIQRVAENPYYDAKQVNLTVDGKLDEWTGMEAISLNQCKDSGDGLPEKDDFSGTVMIGWNEQDSHRIYIAAKIVDDILWDKPVEEDKWYMNDCLEIALDVSADNIAAPVQKCVVATSGTKLSALANDENVECVVVKQGNEYTFEMAIDITKLESIVDITHDFSILAEDIIGLSVCYNDCENEVREHQIGWTPGKASNRGTFGNVRFVTEHVK